MRTHHLLPHLLFTTVALLAVLPVRAADADNSVNNKNDANNSASMTPEDQSNSSQDVKTTAKIRRAIVKDSSLSIYAHNIKIITTKEHKVYLRGAVSSSDDVGKIEMLAKHNAGGDPVMNELSVSSK